MSIRCLCVDDEPLARQGIRLALKPHSDFELVGEFGTVEEALTAVNGDIDLLFLDIEMPRQDGFDLLKQWPETLPLVVFVTAYDHYAVKAFEHRALDYVLNPIDQERFTAVLERARAHLMQERRADRSDRLLKVVKDLQNQMSKQEESLSVKTDDGYFRVKLSEVICLESVGDHVCLHLKDRQLITRQTLKHYIASLAESGFYQVHKSYLVNKSHVERVTKLRFGDGELLMSDQRVIRLSRRFNSVLDFLLG